MPINLIEYASADGLSQLVVVAIEEFADEIEARDLIDGCDEIFRSIKGAVRRWKRGDDVCYQVTGGMLRKNGGAKALAKVEKYLVDMGYERHIVRSVRAPREAR